MAKVPKAPVNVVKSALRGALHVAAIVWLLAAMSGALAYAEDWPQWRGVNRDGVWSETGLLERFPEAGLKEAWRVPIGEGYGGPAVAGGRVYVTDFTREPQSTKGTERLAALDEGTGTTLWSHGWPVDTQGIQQRYANGPRSTPLVDGDRVYTLGSTGRFHCLNVADGSVIWQSDWVADYGAVVPTWGITSSPLVDGDRLIALVGGEPDAMVMAFDKKTGTELWRSLAVDTAPGYSPPVIIEAGGVRQLIVWLPNAIVSLNPETGAAYWQHPSQVSLGQSIATPVYGGGRLYVSSGSYGTTALELGATEPTAKLLWAGEQRKGNNLKGLYCFFSTPFLEGNHLYGVGFDGFLRCIDTATGADLWKTAAATEDARQANAFIVKNGDRFFLSNDRGDLILGKLSPTGFEEIGRTHLIDPTNGNFNGRRELGLVNWVHPAYANGHIVQRNDKEIVRASLKAE